MVEVKADALEESALSFRHLAELHAEHEGEEQVGEQRHLYCQQEQRDRHDLRQSTSNNASPRA